MQIEIITWEVTFFKGDESKPVVFSQYVNREEYDGPKHAAIEHVALKWEAISKEVGEGFLPKFKTFRVLNSRVPDDLRLGR